MAEQRELWEGYIGRLILICGDIELHLLQLYWNLRLGEGYDPSVKKLGFADKAKKLLSMVESWDENEAQFRKRARRVLNDAIKLARRRNLIAHNPLYMDIYTDGEAVFIAGPTIRSLRGSDEHISLDGLKQLIVEAKQIEEDLWGLVEEVGNSWP